MNNIESLRNLSKIKNESSKQNKWGNIHHVIGGFMLFFSIIGLISSLFSFGDPDYKIGIYLMIAYILMAVAFFLEFMHGSNLKHKSRKNSMRSNQLIRMIQNDKAPAYYYNGNNVVHTHFTFTQPYLTEITLENGLLKMKSDRLSIRNKEIVINLNMVTSINFKDVTLKPGYLNLIINGQADSRPMVSDNSIVFLADGKDYVFELKNYLEYLLNQQNNGYWS